MPFCLVTSRPITVSEEQVDCVMVWSNPKCWMADEKRHKKEVSVLCCIYSGKETCKRTSLRYLHDSYPLSHEGIVVYSYEGTITPDLTIMMLYLVRTDVVATYPPTEVVVECLQLLMSYIVFFLLLYELIRLNSRLVRLWISLHVII